VKAEEETQCDCRPVTDLSTGQSVGIDGTIQFNNIYQRWFKMVNSGHPTKPNSTAEFVFLINKKFLDPNNYREYVLVAGCAILICIPWHQDKILSILNIYAPNSPAERRQLWNDVSTGPHCRGYCDMGDWAIQEER
jgi:hypothetical protein